MSFRTLTESPITTRFSTISYDGRQTPTRVRLLICLRSRDHSQDINTRRTYAAPTVGITAMKSKGRGLRWNPWLVAFTMLVAGAVAWYIVGREKQAVSGQGSPGSAGAGSGSGVSVDVVSPRPGGIDRLCVQPGSFEPFEAADLYAKVSGYLIEQKVDIGSRVEAGDMLARIWVPEFEKQVKQDASDVVRANARVEQMKAAIDTAEADSRAAKAAIALAQAEVKSKSAYRAFREKQRDRIRELFAKQAIDGKLVDEQEDQYQAAISAESAAEESVNAAKQKEAAARARVKQAQADLKYAEAEVITANAQLEKSQAMLDYTVIRAPYTGVVTKRNFHPGDFIRSAAPVLEHVPMLAVERIDLMRVVVQVPERDVPFVDIGDPAVVEVDALPGRTFKTTGVNKVEISRFAASEDPHTRMMRVEVDLKNPDGKLRRGMYGRVTLLLESGSPTAIRIPSGALVGKAERGKASVRVVRDDIAHIIPVEFGADNGTDVEILSGLIPADRVVIRAAGPVENGTLVAVTGKDGKPGH
jgi:HlyD family secretion protein